MRWEYTLPQNLLDAAHWTAIAFAGMLAVVFLTWALEVRLQSSGNPETSGNDDVIQVVFPG